jgi:DNA-binding transcriptional LysR family regulator
MPERLILSMWRDLVRFELPVAVEGFRCDIYWPPRLHESPPHRWLRNEIVAAAAAFDTGAGSGSIPGGH